MTQRKTKDKQNQPTPLDSKIAFYSSIDSETLRLEWTRTPNWMEHPLLFTLAKAAISSEAIHNSYVITIHRETFWSIFCTFIVQDLIAFEEELAREGRNARAEASALFKEALEKATTKKEVWREPLGGEKQ